MRVDRRHAAAALAVTLLVCAAWGLPVVQSQQQKPAQPTQQQPNQPADQQQQPSNQQQQPQQGGVLTKKVTLKSSRQGKETASAGFNGVDPSTGKVKDDVIKAAPTADESAKAMQMSIYAVSDADVEAFAKEGNLNLTPQTPAKGKK